MIVYIVHAAVYPNSEDHAEWVEAVFKEGSMAEKVVEALRIKQKEENEGKFPYQKSEIEWHIEEWEVQ